MENKFEISKENKALLEEYFKQSGINADLSDMSEEAYNLYLGQAKEAFGKDKEPEVKEDAKTFETQEKTEESEVQEAVQEEREEVLEEEIILEDKNEKAHVPDAEWVQNLENHWKEWCEDESRQYIYERNSEKEGLAFKYYKSESDKELGNHAVDVHYHSKNDVKIQTKDGKAADYEFWKSFAEAAKKNDQIVNFEKMADEDNKAKLYLACMVNGVKAKNVDAANLNFVEAFKELSEEERKIAQEKLGLDADGNHKLEPVKEEVKEEPKEEVKETDKPKKTVAELRGMVEKPETLSEEEKAYQERKARIRGVMKSNLDISKDDAKSQEVKDIARARYEKALQGLNKESSR